jgi:hypothetical protein
MPELEKRAWLNMAVVVGILFLFVVILKLAHSVAAATAAYALLGLTAVPELKRSQVIFDERDRDIDRKALLTGLRAFWVLLALGLISLGVFLDWDRILAIPVWGLAQVLWIAWIVVLAVKSLATIVLYHSGNHA